MSVYKRPHERVLFDEVRDANPFFHLMESIWMLAGRSDAEFLNQFVKDFGSRFAEDDGYLHGAYGRRWRSHFFHQTEDGAEFFPVDQIQICVEMLRKNREDRRVVITMWDPQTDLGSSARDVPCNTQIYPRVVDGRLDFTVMCRSNDIVWGAYGANAVHFSVLQEVMAAGIGVEIGTLYQLSNNWHGYVDVMEKQRAQFRVNHYENGSVVTVPMVGHYETFFAECENFCRGGTTERYTNDFFLATALPMIEIHKMYRGLGARAAYNSCHNIFAPDWRFACAAWLRKRIK